MAYIRCPHCGSPAMVRGGRWECGWCGDFGNLGSSGLSDGREGCDWTVTVTVSEPQTNRPSLSQEELEGMVRRWEFGERREGEVVRDLLLASFPQAASCTDLTARPDMEETELLEIVYEKDPRLAVRMWRKVLDTAQVHLQDPERAEYLLYDLMGAVWHGSISLWFILEAMEQDREFARQVFGSAYVGFPQEELLKICGETGEQTLQAQLTALLEENPCFDGLD